MQRYTSKAQVLIRLLPGVVFLMEGIQKFLYSDQLGVGRFIKIGIPHAAFWAPFVGVVEIVFGLLLILGLKTRWATIPLLIDMGVAFIYTKWPLLIDKGIFPMFHDYRTDFSMTLCLIFLLITGAGYYSLDRIFYEKRKRLVK
jgi:uncharacterized membrane protein YphA (DoxX/SURF4 family)